MKYATEIFIGKRKISISNQTYFIADIAANHDGDLQRAKDLICLAKEAGANAVKFQHFKASNIVSDNGFKTLRSQLSHQTSWKKSVYEIYEQYECNRRWTEELVATAKEANVDFLTTPYDYEAVELMDKYLLAYKIGSGDITWHQFIAFIAQKKKPVFLATGASSWDEVRVAVNTILSINRNLVLLQCNTNYTGSIENFKYSNLRVLQTYADSYPGMIIGLSDHTPGHTTVLGAIALGARVIEKHFTDDNARIGPDHSFALNKKNWQEMIERSRELEMALGDGIKRVESNEQETIIIQRRGTYVAQDIENGEIINKMHVEFLRPALKDSFAPYEADLLIGKTLITRKQRGDAFMKSDIKDA
jgi:sialic acid synthase SpsE